jgi:hypothetical protein
LLNDRMEMFVTLFRPVEPPRVLDQLGAHSAEILDTKGVCYDESSRCRLFDLARRFRSGA